MKYDNVEASLNSRRFIAGWLMECRQTVLMAGPSRLATIASIFIPAPLESEKLASSLEVYLYVCSGFAWRTSIIL